MFDLQPPRHISTLRILLLAAYPGEGRFTHPTAAVQTWRPELVFMPLCMDRLPIASEVVLSEVADMYPAC